MHFCVTYFLHGVSSINMWLAVGVIGLQPRHTSMECEYVYYSSDSFPKIYCIGYWYRGMFGALGGILLSFWYENIFVHYRAINRIETAYYIMFVVLRLLA